MITLAMARVLLYATGVAVALGVIGVCLAAIWFALTENSDAGHRAP